MSASSCGGARERAGERGGGGGGGATATRRARTHPLGHLLVLVLLVLEQLDLGQRVVQLLAQQPRHVAARRRRARARARAGEARLELFDAAVARLQPLAGLDSELLVLGAQRGALALALLQLPLQRRNLLGQLARARRLGLRTRQ
jgi:hypothetical protein